MRAAVAVSTAAVLGLVLVLLFSSSWSSSGAHSSKEAPQTPFLALDEKDSEAADDVTVLNFVDRCALGVPSAASWGQNRGRPRIALAFDQFEVEGMTCLQGRRVLRYIPAGGRYPAGHSDRNNRTWKAWWTSIPISPLSEAEVKAILAEKTTRNENGVQVVRFHASLLMLVCPAYQMFHAWFDGAVPGAAFLLHYNGGELLAVPRDVVSMYVDGKPRSLGAENATLMVLRDLGRSARQLLPEDDAVSKKSLDCYCGAVLLGSNFFAAVKVRQEATHYLVRLLYSRFGLPRHGTRRPEVHAAIQRAEHVSAEPLWGSACPSTSNASSTPSGGHRESSSAALRPPRLLLLLRRSSRRLGQAQEIVTMAREIGFCVLPFESESYSSETQLRTARGADMVAGVHGQGLSWMIAMDGSRSGGTAAGCRRVLEFQHWGRQLLRRNDVYVMLAQDCGLHYSRIRPVDVAFGPSVANSAAERKALLKAVFPYDFKGFHDQTVLFDLKSVRVVLEGHYAELMQCLDF
jgi:hypothetical protein